MDQPREIHAHVLSNYSVGLKIGEKKAIEGELVNLS